MNFSFGSLSGGAPDSPTDGNPRSESRAAHDELGAEVGNRLGVAIGHEFVDRFSDAVLPPAG